MIILTGDNRYKITFREFLDENEANELYFDCLKFLEKLAVQAQGSIYGKTWKSSRKSLQIAEAGIRRYKYNGAPKTDPLLFSNFPFIEEVKKRLEKELDCSFNFCLVNFYDKDAMLGWHSDDEKDMIPCSTIASVSLGMERRFGIKFLEEKRTNLYQVMSHGTLITMEGETQKLTQHQVPKIRKKDIISEKYPYRINLTFRNMKPK